MSASLPAPLPPPAPADWNAAAQAMFRAAQAVSHAGGPGLFADLVRELAHILGVATVFVAVFTDERRTRLRTLAATLDGRVLQNFDYPLEGSPCAQVVGRAFRHVERGVAAEFRPGTLFAAKGMDAYAAFPLNDAAGTPLGLLVAMDRGPLADARLTEALLKIFAGRIAAEIERGRADEALRAAALAVSSARGGSVFVELVRYLAAILQVEVAFIARYEPGDPQALRMQAMVYDGEVLENIRYELKGTPCATVLGQSFRAYPARLRELFPDDHDARLQGTESYAGYPMRDLDGHPLGNISVASRRPLVHLDRIESMLQIFAVRAAAELEQLRAREALERSAASYRAIFEATEDAVFIHDWDTGRILDVNPKACEVYGWSRDDLKRLSVADLSSGEPPYTAEQALHYLQLAKLGRCPPFEWHRRNRDGTLRWDEVHLKPAQIDGRPHVLAFTRDITERKRAEQALRASEQQYRAIFDGTVDAMVLWDRGLRVVDVNAAFVATTGLAREQVVGRHWTERPDARDVAGLLGLIEGALAGRIGLTTTTVSRADGSLFEIELRYLPVRLGDDAYALGVGRDVSDRLERERRLRDSEAQYRSIFNASADALVLRDADFRIVDVNATYERLSGYGRDEAVGVDRVIANPAAVAPTIRALHERALAGEPIALEVPLVRRDGTRHELELRGVPILHRGQPHVLYIGRDVTERKHAEQALRASEAQYRAIFNASADALILWNSHYQRVDVNPAYERIYGYTRDEVVGRGFDGPQGAPEYARPRRELVRRALAGEACSAVLEAQCKDGRRILTEVSTIPFTHGGEPHVLAIARDINERRAAEAERARLETQLRQAQKMEAIGQLTGGIAHDFNNILTSVLGYLVLGQERARALGDERLTRQLGQAELAAQRARDLIAQMLAFARRQRGERRTLALAPLVQQSLQLLRPTLPATVALDTLMPPDLPPVSADAVQVEQVLFNLCINARDAIDGHGGIRVSLGVADAAGLHCSSCGNAVGAGRWVELGVADTGSGIAPDVLRRMFEPFYTTKEIGRGSGMGLAMVHGIVHEHGGHVVVETRPGEGTSFRVLLPAGEGTGPAAAPDAASSRAAGETLAGRVLVVEDEAMVGDFMAELLGGWGLQVVLQRDPLAALAWLEDAANAVDLLVTDQTMPQMTGLELARRCREARPGLAVLLYTGRPDAVDAEALERHGVRALLRKPVEADALRAALRSALASTPD
jgi:PAS domain S-box-containing protein